MSDTDDLTWPAPETGEITQCHIYDKDGKRVAVFVKDDEPIRPGESVTVTMRSDGTLEILHEEPKK